MSIFAVKHLESYNQYNMSVETMNAAQMMILESFAGAQDEKELNALMDLLRKVYQTILYHICRHYITGAVTVGRDYLSSPHHLWDRWYRIPFDWLPPHCAVRHQRRDSSPAAPAPSVAHVRRNVGPASYTPPCSCNTSHRDSRQASVPHRQTQGCRPSSSYTD